jgi:hypothetical protein
MQITIVPTEKLLSLTDLERHEFPRMVRVWEGVTDSGVPCMVLVSGVAVHKTENQSAFDKELKEFIPKDRYIELRHIL